MQQRTGLILSVMLCLGSFWALPSSTYALDESDVLFYAPFEGSISPVVHVGGTSGVQDSKNIRFVKGALGQGILVGDVGSLLRYPALGNIDCKAGSLSMWVRIHWIPKIIRNLNHSIVNIPGKLDCSHLWWGTMLFSWLDNGSRGMANYPGPSWVAGKDGEYEWVHMVFTWDAEGNFISYYNGNKALHVQSGKDLGKALNATDFFSLCDPSLTVGDHNRTEIDELTIFNRPLSLAEVKTLYRRSVAQTRQTMAVIPLQKSRVSGDGNLKLDIWNGSFETIDFIDEFFGTLRADALKMNIISDAEGIYLLIQDQKRLADSNNNNTWEIFIKPVGDVSCRIFRYTNSKKGPPITSMDSPWKADVKLIDGGRYVLRAFIPWSSMGLANADKDKTFETNIIRRYSGKIENTLSWVDTRKGNTYAKIIPCSEAGSVKITQFGNLDGCQLDLVADVKGKPNAVTAELYLQPSDLREYYDPKTMPGTKSFTGKQFYVKKTFADGAIRFKWNFNNTDFNSAILRIADSQGRELYQTQKEFTPVPPLVSLVKLFPGHERVEVTSTILKNKNKTQDDLTASISLYDSKNNLLDQAQLSKFITDSQTVNFSMTKLPKGNIKVVSALFSKGKEVFDTETSFERLETSPEWIKHPAGIERRVTHDFSSIKIDDSNGRLKLMIWGREYYFDNSLLPTEISSQSRKLLHRPATLAVFAGDKELKGEPAQIKVTQTTDDQVSFTISQKIGGYQVLTDNRLEFDGMVWTQMKIVPPKKGIRLDRVWLEFPFVSEESTLLHANNCAVSNKQFSSQTPSSWQKEFTPVVWLGNENVGNCFFVETPAGWNLAEPKRFYEVKRDNQETCLRINIVDHEVSLQKPIEISFGWFATPVRLLPEDWLAWGCPPVTGIQNKPLAMKWLVMDTYWDGTNQYLHEALPWEWFKQFSESTRAQGVIGMKYSQTRYLSFYKDYDQAGLEREKAKCRGWNINIFETPERKFWADEWKITPTQDELCTNTEWRDLICAGLNERLEKGDIDCIYFDCSYPMPCSNPLHGCHQRYDLLSQREIRRRLTNLFEAEGKRARIVEHVSDNMLGPQMSFASWLFDGEHLSGGVENNDFRKDLTLDRMRVMSVGTNWGIIPLYMYYGKPDNLILADSFMAIWALHMPIHNIMFNEVLWGDHLPIQQKGVIPENMRLAFLLDFEFNFDKNTRRLGYWENAKIVHVSPENVKVTIYSKPGRIFLVASNLSDNKVSTTINMDMKSLGLTSETTALVNYVPKSSETPQYGKGILITPINPNSAFMCIISEENKKR